MTVPPTAWPESDEDQFSARSELLQQKLAEVQPILDSWRRVETSMFDGSTWFGQASSAAQARTKAHVESMDELQRQLNAAIVFHTNSYFSLVNAKKTIVMIAAQAQGEIDSLDPQSFPDTKALEQRIEEIVNAAFRDNEAVVTAAGQAVAADQIYPGNWFEAAATNGPGASSQADSGAPDGNADGVAHVVQPPKGAPASGGTTESQGALDTNADEIAHVVKPDQLGTPAGGSTSDSHGAPDTNTDGVAHFVNPVPVNGIPTSGGIPGANTDSSGTHSVQSGGAASTVAPPSGAGASGGGAPPPASSATRGPSSSAVMGPSGGTSSGGASSSGGSSAPSPSTSSGSQGSSSDGESMSKLSDAKPDAGQGASGGQQSAGTGQPKLDEVAKAMSASHAQAVPAAQQPIAPAANAMQPVVPPTLPVDPGAAANASGASGAAGGSGGSVGNMGGGGGGGGGVSASPSMPVAPPAMPLGPPSTPSPAAPTPPPGGTVANPTTTTAGASGPGVSPASAGRLDPGAMGAAPVPVSAARLERDAIVSASAGGAMNRKRNNGNAALIQARRIAAALNMGVGDFGFYWVTGLTADGSIVVANSFGLGYIPESVYLPDQVALATADESILPQERAKWATYPVLAIQGWAQARGQKLRAVIATEEQFASFDPGVPKVILRPDDIPESGQMQGRGRLEVIAPETSARLAAVPDAGLVELLPPAPTDTSAPADNSNALWFELIKPLMSTSPERASAHLEAFVTYAEHAQDQALYRAHIAPNAVLQRAAITDWVYWQHLGVLMTDALATGATVV